MRSDSTNRTSGTSRGEGRSPARKSPQSVPRTSPAIAASGESTPVRTFPRLPVARPHAAADQMTPEDPETPSAPAPPLAAPLRATPEEFLRVGRVATMLDVSTKRVYQLVRAGRLLAMRIGPRQVRVSARSLELYVRERMREESEREDHAR